MYLSKKQVKALEVALEALDYGLRCDIQQEESTFATDVIGEMLRKSRAQKHNTKTNTYTRKL